MAAKIDVNEVVSPLHGEPILGEALTYLDELRASGETNMFAAPSWVEQEFGIDRPEALALWLHWTETFTERHPSTFGSPRHPTT
jgi:hypothetical protein